MSENKNIELNDDMMAKVSGGEEVSKGRKEPGTVRGPYLGYSPRRFEVELDCGPEVVAEYDLDGLLLEPGTRVKVLLSGNRWRIIEIIR
ncbi:MAG: hypothetical protein K6A76_07030 [Oribacterium sp.]|nr:hypothetical protein [Oribacterium sp.]